MKREIGEEVLSHSRRIPTFTPCAGRCSTTFGDHVCRGCRRFSHEIIQWNSYSQAQQYAVWQRLDDQLDRILVRLLPHANKVKVEHFLVHKRSKLLPQASYGRKLYNALRLCEKNKHLIDESGLNIEASHIKPIWQKFEKQVLLLAQASYEVAWVRATTIQKTYN